MRLIDEGSECNFLDNQRGVIVSNRLGSPPTAPAGRGTGSSVPAVKREAEEDWA
jgi:hypothetical protein